VGCTGSNSLRAQLLNALCGPGVLLCCVALSQVVVVLFKQILLHLKLVCKSLLLQHFDHGIDGVHDAKFWSVTSAIWSGTIITVDPFIDACIFHLTWSASKMLRHRKILDVQNMRGLVIADTFRNVLF